MRYDNIIPFTYQRFTIKNTIDIRTVYEQNDHEYVIGAVLRANSVFRKILTFYWFRENPLHIMIFVSSNKLLFIVTMRSKVNQKTHYNAILLTHRVTSMLLWTMTMTMSYLGFVQNLIFILQCPKKLWNTNEIYSYKNMLI